MNILVLINLTNFILADIFFDVFAHPFPVEVTLSPLNSFMIFGMTKFWVGMEVFQKLGLKRGALHNPQTSLFQDEALL